MRMELHKGKTISFHEENHQYYYEGEKVISTTQLLEKVGLRPAMPDTEYIRSCAEFGTLIHKEIEDYEREGKKPLSLEGRFWVKYGHPLADAWEVEVMFGNEEYAGTCDAIGRKADGSIILVDHKTGQIDKDLVSWQLSLYWYGLVTFHKIPPTAPVSLICYDAKGYDGRFIDISLKSTEEIQAVLNAYRNGQTYQEKALTVCAEEKPLTEDEEKQLQSLLSRVPEQVIYDMVKNRLKKSVEELDKRIKAELAVSGMKRAQTPDGYVWTYTEYDENRFDKDEMLKRYPKLGPKIIKACTVTTHRTRLNYLGRVTDDEA